MFLINTKSNGKKKPFKYRYKLTERQSIMDFEKKMVKGMFKERKEVFVTSFCCDDVSLAATATIGTKYRCSNSDNIYNWPNKCRKLGADEIRIYHNHPNIFLRSFASDTDMETANSLSNFLKTYNIKFKSFLVYQKRLGGYSIRKIYG